MLEKLDTLIDSHFKHIVDRLALVVDFKSLAVIASALAHFAGNINIRQEVHFDLDYAVTLAGFTASALDIERESAACVSVSLCVVGLGEQVADIGENSRIRCGI